MTKSGHFGDAELDELHDVIDGGREEGACLTGHLADFKKRRNQVSCNYRWQCYEGNQADSSITERLERYKDVEHKARYRTDLRVTKTTDWLLKYCFFVPAPEEGDWDIGGPSKDLKRRTFAGTKTKIPAGENFTSALWPYYNNAHHIIPKGTLKSEIAATNVSDIVQKGLLKAKYNINHAKNMIFLPMDKRIGQILHLPRHLEFRGKMSHPTYDTYSAAEPVAGGKTEDDYEIETEEGLSQIIDDFVATASDAETEADGTHKIPDVSLSKARLEKLSKDLLETILIWGETGTGESLDEHAEADLED